MKIKNLVEKARVAQAFYEENFDQRRTDEVVRAIAKVVYDNAERLARLAVDETKMGVYEDKVSKCKGKSKGVWYNLKGKKSMGILEIDPETNLTLIAKPMGVVCGVIPMTNPVVTPMSKAMFALKTKNAIIVSPHPKAKECTGLTVKLIQEAISKLGVPQDMIQVVEEPTLEDTLELMASVDVVLATGGMAMVKSAYSSGKPSYGVGAGNVQVILDRHINYHEAAAKVITGRKYDNGIICTGEQSFIYPRENKEEVFKAFKDNGAYFVEGADREKLASTLFIDGKINRDVVGQFPQKIADLAGIKIPADAKILVMEAKGAGEADVICKEKMCPVMCCLPYDSFEEAIEIARTNLKVEGRGHSCVIHSNDEAHILMVGSKVEVSRVIVNAISATTAGGAVGNGLAVTNTLGCGSWGNNSLSENLTFKHLMNITRVANPPAGVHIPTDEEIWAN